MERKVAATGPLWVLLGIAACYLAIRALAPPASLPVDASKSLFSGERAAAHLETLAASPRTLGSAGNDRAREFLLDQIRELDLKPQVQTSTVQWQAPGPGWVTFATVKNVLTRFRSERQSHPLLLSSHYDTVPNSPGAADAGAGVVTLLEVMRALVEGPPISTDVVFLFTDSEELGLNGARIFMDEHPWAEKVKMLINLDARGIAGPTLAFQTTDGAAPLVDALARSGSEPAAFSFSQEVYKRLPNTTDFAVLSEGGAPGLNFAFFGGPTGYHTALDRIDRVSHDSIQQGGETVLGLIRQVDEVGIGADWSGEESVYFSLLGGQLISYPRSLALMLSVGLFLAVCVLLVLGISRGRLKAGRLLLSIVAILAVVLVSPLVAQLLIPLLFNLQTRFELWQGVDSHTWMLLALTLVATSLFLWLAGWLSRRLGESNFAAAGLFLWAVLTVLVSIGLAGAGYLFTLPLLVATLTWLFDTATGDDGGGSWRLAHLIALGATVVIAALLWAPALRLLAMALHVGAALFLAGALSLLFFALLVPAAQRAAQGRAGSALLALLLIVGVALGAAVLSSSGHDARNPIANSLIYGYDADSGTARWFTFDSNLDSWTSQYLGETPQSEPFPQIFNSNNPVVNAPAPPLDAEVAAQRTATLEATAERFNPATRQVDLRVDWEDDPDRAILAFASNGTVQGLIINGTPVKQVANAASGGAFRTLVRYYGPPAEGLDIKAVLLPATADLRVEVLGDWAELPAVGGQPAPSRPAEYYARPGVMIDSTLVYSALDVPVGSVQTDEDEGSE